MRVSSYKCGAGEDHLLNALRQVAIQSTVRAFNPNKFVDKEGRGMPISCCLSLTFQSSSSYAREGALVDILLTQRSIFLNPRLSTELYNCTHSTTFYG